MLIVEDEALLRMMASTFIEDAGFGVIEAGNADDALGILELRSDIKIVFADIDMPGSMNGLGLAAITQERWPHIEIVLTSGKFTNLRLSELPARATFFPKPYHPDRVIDAMRRIAA